MKKRNLVIIGGGPAGLAAAISARKKGIDDILIIERETNPGGILRQCIHDGFGLHKFNEALTGPEYADRYIKEAGELEIPILTDSIVTDLTRDKVVTVVNRKKGLFKIKAKAVILAMGSRERTAGAISLPGKRPAGIFTAGLVQNFMNLKNMMVAKKAVILGSGDIGLIMARRLTLEGADVEAVVEIMPYPSGLNRNITQCLKDYNIPLKLSHTVIDVQGDERLEAVVIAEVDENRQPIPGTEKKIECDTLLLSVGLIPENELSRKAGVQLDYITGGALVKENLETNVPGIFSAGNVLHIHDVVDFVSDEADRAGESAARYIKEGSQEKQDYIFVEAGEDINYVLPQLINTDTGQELSMRVRKPATNCKIQFMDGDNVIYRKSFRALHPSEMKKIKLNEDILGKNIRSLKVVLT